MPVTQRDVRALKLQTALSWAAFPIVGTAVVVYLRVIRGYRIRHLSEIRHAFRAAVVPNRPIAICTIFPEGGRSRTGRIDPERVTYGIGQILKDYDNPLVVCLYVRGKHQTTYSYLPRRGDEIYVDLELLEPKTEATGLRKARDIARQVIFKLKEMEDRYFAIEIDSAFSVDSMSPSLGR